VRSGSGIELRIELASNVVLTVSLPDTGVSVHSADLGAIRAAAAPLLDELARRQLATKDEETV
jgi:hypothetical protein